MNQFKKAKQIGNQTERITDLKTAGVATVAASEEKSPKQDAEIPIKKEENNSAELQADILNAAQPVIPENSTILPNTEAPISTAEKISDITTPSYEAEAPSYSTPETKPEIISQPAIYNEEASLQTAGIQPQEVSPVKVIPPAVQQPQYSEPAVTYVEPVETKPVKSNKKSIPNMFTQKSESKSTRKSLVLKPSSVKKAEIYCEKNGGSFNELIQILLDNFIDEYGL